MSFSHVFVEVLFVCLLILPFELIDVMQLTVYVKAYSSLICTSCMFVNIMLVFCGSNVVTAVLCSILLLSTPFPLFYPFPYRVGRVCVNISNHNFLLLRHVFVKSKSNSRCKMNIAIVIIWPKKSVFCS